ILARHAFSEAAGTCAGYTIKEVMDYYKMQVKRCAGDKAHLGIVKTGCGGDGMVLVHNFIPPHTSLGEKIV
ncbi:hypothetical protein HDV05_002654, partial [Chytridiales sp. JEL 0842]